MATSFPSFPLLPKELRLAIWKLALEPRIVELCFEVADEEDKKGNEREGEGHNEKLGNEEHGNANEEEDQRDESEDEGGTRDPDNMRMYLSTSPTLTERPASRTQTTPQRPQRPQNPRTLVPLHQANSTHPPHCLLFSV